MTPKAQMTEEKIYKLDFITIKNLFIGAHEAQSENATQRMGKISANPISEEGSMPLYPLGFNVSNR